MISRPDLLDKRSPEGIEVFQLTDDPALPSCHIYMEAQIFTPDSRYFVLHRSAHAHGSDKDDPRHVYQLCDVETGALAPLTVETGATGPSLSPDGKYLYYFVNETKVNDGRLTLKRVRLDGTERETIVVVDAPLTDRSALAPVMHKARFRPSRIYPLSTISSDGERIIISGFLGDGRHAHAPWGMMVFDIPRVTVALTHYGPSWQNLHPQYCRSLDAEASHDVLIQENHENFIDAQGIEHISHGGLGADIHVLRDDGTNFRNMPWGRDGNEFCQGHQCWIGRSTRAVTSTMTVQPPEWQLIAGRAVPGVWHVGRHTPGGERTDLTRDFPNPQFWHFATDIAGKRFIADGGQAEGGCLYYAHIPDDEDRPLYNFTYLLTPRTSFDGPAHMHPFISPDGATGFFNSDESGTLQAYMIRGLARL